MLTRWCAKRMRLAMLLAAGAVAAGCGGEPEAKEPLYCYVGGTMRPAMSELVKIYAEKTGRKIELDFGDSGSNMIKAETTDKGDLYVAHDPFHGAMVRKGLATDSWVLAEITPMIAVPEGNPDDIQGLPDLAKPGMRVVLTDPQYSTVGHVNKVMFRRAGLTDEIMANVDNQPRMGGEAANAVAIGAADAAIVWNAVIHQRDEKLDAVPIAPDHRPDAEVDAVTSATFGPIDMRHMRVTVDVLSSAGQPEAARELAAFLAGEEAQEVWSSRGFDAPQGGARKIYTREKADGSAAAEWPLRLYAGAGLQPMLEDVIHAFAETGGPPVEVDYGGSGQLIPRIKLSGKGDLFMPGDVWYVERAEGQGLVASKHMVGYFVPVILTRKGLDPPVDGLADLVRSGLKLGLGSPEYCQIGRVSRKLFERNGIEWDAVRERMVYASATVNELGVQIAAGDLDAVIVWDAIASLYADRARIVRIPPEKNEISRVAIAVLESSRASPAARRFVEFLTGPEGRAILSEHNYRFDPPTGAGSED